MKREKKEVRKAKACRSQRESESEVGRRRETEDGEEGLRDGGGGETGSSAGVNWRLPS